MPLIDENVINNKYVHDKVSSKYNKRHAEIYNIYEQERVSKLINKLLSFFNNNDIKVLDF
jgi:hypothetical protein